MSKKTSVRMLGLILALAVLSLTVFQILGAIELTRFAFKAKPDSVENGEEKYCLTLSKRRRNYARVTMVVFWVGLGLQLLNSLMSLR